MKMSGRTILITGGAGGIGRALAELLIARGNTVLVTGRTEARLAAARQALPGLHTYVCDQGDADAVARLCADVVRDVPALDVLINNAGVGLKRDLQDAAASPADLAREVAVNVTGPILMVAGLLAHLKRQPEALIVNVTSGLAFVPLPQKPIYCATKAAMHSYTQSLRVQLTRTSVKVVELAPPAVATDFNKGQEDMDTGRRMAPEALAEAAVRGLEQGRSEILPGPAASLHTI